MTERCGIATSEQLGAVLGYPVIVGLETTGYHGRGCSCSAAAIRRLMRGGIERGRGAGCNRVVGRRHKLSEWERSRCRVVCCSDRFVGLLDWLLSRTLGREVRGGLDHQFQSHELLLDQVDDGGEILLTFDGVDVVDPNLEQLLEELGFDVLGNGFDEGGEEGVTGQVFLEVRNRPAFRQL